MTASIKNRLLFLKSLDAWIKGAMALSITVVVWALLQEQVGALYSSSPSCPYRWFLWVKPLSPQHGRYTVVSSAWYGGLLIKQIKGVGGDQLHYDAQGRLWVGRQKIGKPYAVDSRGKPLTPLKAQTIPPGQVFLSGTHARSFDSRYEELGLVPLTALQGRAFAIY